MHSCTVDKQTYISQVRVYHVTIPGTFVEVELPENAPLFKEGFVLRKNVMEGPHKKGQPLLHVCIVSYCRMHPISRTIALVPNVPTKTSGWVTSILKTALSGSLY